MSALPFSYVTAQARRAASHVLFTVALLAPALAASGNWEDAPSTSVGDAPTADRVAPKPSKIVSPQHPAELWDQRITGTADVECLVTVEGKVAEARVVSASRPEFGEAALEAVKQWEFEPGTKNGNPMQMKIRIPLNFAIGNEDSLESFLGRKLYQDVPGEIVRAETLTKLPLPKNMVSPRYPPSLRGSGKKGKAVVAIVITPEGKVINPKIVKATYPEFTFPALAAAASLTFPAQSKKDQEKSPLYIGMDLQFDFNAEGGKPPEKKGEAPKKSGEKSVTKK
jgi:TonB family protein